MSSFPVPDKAIEFIPRSNADEWRGVKDSPLALHKTPGLVGDFRVLATDGVVSVIEVIHSGLLGILNNSNICFVKKEKDSSPRPLKVSKPRPKKLDESLLSDAEMFELFSL